MHTDARADDSNDQQPVPPEEEVQSARSMPAVGRSLHDATRKFNVAIANRPRDMQVFQVSSYSYAEKTLNAAEFEAIQAERTNVDKTYKLMEYLSAKGESGAENFVAALRKCGAHKFADQMGKSVMAEAGWSYTVRSSKVQLDKQIKENEESMRKQQEKYQLQSQELENEREERQKLQKLLDLNDKRWKVAQEQQESQIKENEESMRKLQGEYQRLLQQLELEREERQKLQKRLDLKENVVQVVWTAIPASWRYPTCYDVAVTDEGTLLVAASEQGLKECDTRGSELHCWRPTRPKEGEDESVCTVDVLDDGRAAVGLFASKQVVLLRRSSACDGAWLQDKCVAVLQTPARQLSVHGKILAACENRWNSEESVSWWPKLSTPNHWVPGPQLVLVKLDDTTSLCRSRLEYDIGSVAVTDLIVVAASEFKVELSDMREMYVVDGYNYSGDRLWRHEPSCKVIDVVPFGLVLYLAVCDNVVQAIGIDDRQHLTDVVACDRPYALSLAKRKQSVLAVIRRDEKNHPCQVTLYRASGSTR